MSAFTTIEVPFQLRGNRRYLTERQVADDPALFDFICRFRDSFDFCWLTGCYTFIEQDGDGLVPDDSREPPSPIVTDGE